MAEDLHGIFIEVEVSPGVIAGHRLVPVQRVGAYLPAGRFPLLASAFMTVLVPKYPFIWVAAFGIICPFVLGLAFGYIVLAERSRRLLSVMTKFSLIPRASLRL